MRLRLAQLGDATRLSAILPTHEEEIERRTSGGLAETKHGAAGKGVKAREEAMGVVTRPEGEREEGEVEGCPSGQQ